LVGKVRNGSRDLPAQTLPTGTQFPRDACDIAALILPAKRPMSPDPALHAARTNKLISTVQHVGAIHPRRPMRCCLYQQIQVR